MTTWGDGYVTDIPYTVGWYSQQSPAILALTALMCSVEATRPTGDDPVHLLELGCGRGLGAMLQAASNPSWLVTAIDFNPAHIAEARAWAHAAGLKNINFIEADLSSLAESAAAQGIPEADFVTIHGVWSWVSPAVRQGIVKLLRDKVRPGGLVHVSYNALPGWGARLGMQRLLRTVGLSVPGRSDRQAEEGLKFLRALEQAEAIHLAQSPSAKNLLSRLDQFPAGYLAHEFMNGAWSPCFMADVAEAMSGAKLEWVGSAQLTDNFPVLTLSEAQYALQRQFDDPITRELIRDMSTDNPFRHDVYVRGARRITQAKRDAALMDVDIALNILPESLPLEVPAPAGKAELNPAFYQPIAQALRDGPCKVGALLGLPDVEGRRDNPAELLGILVGYNFATPAARSGAAPGVEARLFNRMATYRFAEGGNLNQQVGVASYRLGVPVRATVLDMLVADCVDAGLTGANQIAARATPDPEQQVALQPIVQEVLDNRIPVLRATGVI